MGLTIRITINPDAITDEQWAAVYDESLLLLAKFPVPLMRLVEETRHGQKCYVYTPAIVEGRGTSYENWRISGDLVSYQHGETFDLHRKRAREFQERRNDDERDVLWVDEADLHYPTGNGFQRFGGKTQGYPYHLAVLAVAILVESRFPQRAFVFGDIERFQVEQMVQWANAVLNTPVVEPVCFDGERLYQRLTALYTEPAQVIARFKALFLGTEAMDYFVEAATLLDHCAAYAPKQRARFRKIIAEAEPSCRKQLGEVQELSEQLEKRAAARQESKTAEQNQAAAPIAADLLSPALPGTAYILQQVQRQQEEFPELKILTTALGHPVQKIMQAHADVFSVADRDLLLTMLTRAT